MTDTISPAALCAQVADSCRVLGDNGHGDYTQGHVAIRDPEGRGIWMKAAARGLDEVQAADVLLVGWDGEVLEGSGVRHAEWPIHSEVMLARPQVYVTVHTHAPHAIALGASGKPLRAISHPGTLFSVPDLPRFSKTTDLIVDREMGGCVAELMGDRPGLLLVNHGLVTVGSTHYEAVMRAVLLEQACHHQLLAEAMGGVAHWTPDDEVAVKAKRIGHPAVFEDQFSYLLRRAGRRGVFDR
jgi:L-fuculose-phosphate aldolase